MSILILHVVALLLAGVESWRPGRPILPVRNGVKSPLPDGISYKIESFDQQIDHFGFVNNQTFKQRYLIADQFWNHKGGPIFFYTGNEGDIEWFCNNTGFMWDIAPDFKALLVFAEHRYYGKSLPYGPDTFKNSTNLNYLTSEQALADFATLIAYLKSSVAGAAQSPVVAFGGSYGGMLAAWFRIKYPNVVIGSLAASAPIWQFKGLTPCGAFYSTASKTWEDASEVCAENVHNSYTDLTDILSTAEGFKFISTTFGLCTPLQTMLDVPAFIGFLQDTYVNFAMVDYPYASNFLAPLPAWPVKAACSFLAKPMKGKPLIEALAKVTNLYYNYTGEVKCVNWTSGGSTTDLGYMGWNYQSCTEMVMPMCSNNTKMFVDMDWDFEAFSQDCYKNFKVRPRQDWVSLQYWGKQLKDASNIIFSNGLYDPWSSGGVLQPISDTVVAIQIPYGAHHLDMRAANLDDTRGVLAARQQEKNIIRNWLGQTPV